MFAQTGRWVTFSAVSFSFGDVVRRGRERAGFSQAKVAQLIGKSQSTIRAWEQGRSNPADPQAVSTLAAVLGLNEEDLLHRAGFEAPIATTARKSAREELSALTAEHTITTEIAPAVREVPAFVNPRHLHLTTATSPIAPEISDLEPAGAFGTDQIVPVDGGKPFDLDEVTELDVLAPPDEAAQVAKLQSPAPVGPVAFPELIEPEPVELVEVPEPVERLEAPEHVDLVEAPEPGVTAPLEVAAAPEPVQEAPKQKPPKPAKVTAVHSLPLPITVGPAISYVEDEEEREFYRRRAISTAIVSVSLAIIFWWALKRAGGAIVEFVASLVDGLNF
jgi:transcriptional regulator with XRE-family HTH domain